MSDNATQDESAFRRFSILLIATFFSILAVAGIVILVFDPYDSGRLPTFMPAGVSDQSPRTANVSRGRDPQFNAAIFGNSHMQLLNPSILSSLSKLRFVQLTAPGTGVREQMATLGWFLRHHPEADTLVLGIDSFWCTQSDNFAVPNPFPFWLYGDMAGFLAHSLESRAFALIWRRLLVAAGRLVRTDPAGYWDYEIDREWNYHPEIKDWPIVDLSPREQPGRSFPALDFLERSTVDAGFRGKIVFVMPPLFRAVLPEPDSTDALDIKACKAEVVRRIRRRPGSIFIDFLKDTPMNRDPRNYMDAQHYRAPIARRMEREIAAAITK